MKTILIALLFGICYAIYGAATYEEPPEDTAKRTLNDGARFQSKIYKGGSVNKSSKYTDDRGLYCMDINYMTARMGRVFQTLCYLGDEDYEIINGFSTR